MAGFSITVMTDVWFWAGLVKRGYDILATYGAPYNSEEFVVAYSEASKKAVDLLGDVQGYSAAELEAGATGMLRLIASVVTAYHRDKGADINANYMLPVQPTPELVARAKFCTKDRRHNSFGCFLELEGWASDDRGFPRDLLIPVERLDEAVSTDALLMGAPWAFAHGKSYLVEDTLHLYEHLSTHENYTIRVEVKEYFERHKHEIRSFISLPVAPPADEAHRFDWPAIAIVNIQSNKPRLMGWFPGNRRKLELTLAPLVQTFSHFVMRLYYNHPPREE